MTVALVGILVFGLVVFVHELGHFLVAKACGVPIDRFSIGFGPKLFGFQRGRTEYVVAAFPLGGYVKMAGEDVETTREGDTDPERVREELQADPDTFLGHPWWHRVLIALAGPFANFVLAIVITIIMFVIGISTPDGLNVVGRVESGSPVEAAGLRERDLIVQVDGQPTTTRREVAIALLGGEDAPRSRNPTDVSLLVERDGTTVPIEIPADRLQAFVGALTFYQPAVVGEVVTGMPAYVAGLKEGDRIVAIDRVPVRDWSDLIDLVAARGGEALILTVQRGGDTIDLKVTPMKQKEDGKEVGRIGIWPEYREFVQKFPPGEAIVAGTLETVARVAMTAKGLLSLFANPTSIGDSVSGPIAIMEMSGQAAKRGLSALMNITAMISIALMVFNLLPIPILDGGMVVMSVAEGIRRRPVPIRIQAAFQRVGFVLLGSLIVFALLNDPLKMLRRNRAISESKNQRTTESGRVAPDDSAR